MIDIIKTDDLTFTVRFDPQITPELADIAGNGSVEDALTCILSDALVRPDHYRYFDCDRDDDVPF